MVSYPLLVMAIRISASRLFEIRITSKIIWYPKTPESPEYFENVLNVLEV